MLITLFRYIQGYLKIRVTGYSPERFLNLCKNKKINIWGLESRHNAYDMYITVKGFRKLKPILKKTQTKTSIQKRYGLPFFFHKYRKRKLFFIGIFISISIVYSMTFFVWNIDIEGNKRITDDVLIEFLEKEEVYHGMLKHHLNCEQLAKKVRNSFNDIIWVSVSAKGTRLFIQVKENDDTFVLNETIEEACDLVSEKEGIVTSIITRCGVPMVTVGDTVLAGDMLVSGTIDVLNDAKDIVSQKQVVADADVILQTVQIYEDFIPRKYDVKHYTKRNRRSITLLIGNYRMNVGILKHSFEKYETHVSSKQISIDENFYLPIYIGSTEILEYELKSYEYTDEQLKSLLNENFKQYCGELEASGILILNRNVEIKTSQEGARMEGTLVLQESVGVRRKIIDF